MSVRCLFTLNKNHASKGGGTYIDKFRITMKKLTSSRKGGNYGWSMYEGPFRFKNASGDDSADPIFPVLGYNHSGVNKKVGSAAISGGYV